MLTTKSWADALDKQLFVSGKAADLIGSEASSPEDWKLFADSWNRLPVDKFMARGESYRRRRHSVFNVYPDERLEQLPPRPYIQSAEINHLEGGIPRSYEQIESEVAASALFAGLLTGFTAVLTELHGPDVWHHQCFQNRVTTNREQTGDPTPWGAHCDGGDYVVTLLVARHSMHGGQSGLYDASTRKRIYSETLIQPGDMLLADDERTLHDATRITPTDPAESGYRDVFIDVIMRGSTSC